MRKFLLGRLLLFILLIGSTQAQVYEWLHSVGVNGANDQANSVAYDSKGSVLTTGHQNLTGGNVYLQKIDSSGIEDWLIYFTGTTAFNTGLAVATDKSDNVVMTGSFQDSLGLIGGGFINSNGFDDIFVAKYTSAGTYQWGFAMGGFNIDQGQAITTDLDNNVYVTGYFVGTVDFDPSGSTADLTSAGGDDIFIAKYDSNGNYLWAHNFGSAAGNNKGFGVKTDAAGNVYFTGQFFGTVDFNAGAGSRNLTAASGSNLFIAKYNSAGIYQWAYQITESVAITDLEIDASANIYLTGSFMAPVVDFDPSGSNNDLTKIGNRDIFFAKYNSDGDHQWAYNIGAASSACYSNGIAVDPENNVYITGYFFNSLDADPGAGIETLTSSDGADMFVAKYAASGAYEWAFAMGSAGFDQSIAIDVSANKKIAIGGYWTGTVDFDPGTGTASRTTPSGNEAFTAQYSNPPCNAPDIPSVSLSNFTICEGDSATFSIASGNLNDATEWYWYLDGCGTTLIDSGTSTKIAPSATTTVYVRGEGGCVTPGGCMNATVNVKPITYGAFSDAFCNGETYMLPSGKTTTVGGVIKDTITGSNNCDSVITATLTRLDNSSASMDTTVCNSFTSPSGKMFTMSSIFNDTIMNNVGCDSLITIDLTVNHSTSSMINAEGCESYTSPSGKNWTMTGMYSDTISNAGGCDSIIAIDLTINGHTDSTLTIEACNTYMSPSGKALDSTGTYMDTIANAKGCDSVLTINLTINDSSSSSLEVDTCGSYTWFGTAYTMSGQYTHTLTNAVGCDSVITLTLTIPEIDKQVTVNGTTLMSDENNADTYQWIDCNDNNSAISGATQQSYTATESGDYAVVISKDGCSDTSDCEEITITSLQGIVANHSINVWPIQTKGSINIDLKQNYTDVTISALNIIGQQEIVTNYENIRNTSIELSNNGMHILKIHTEGNLLGVYKVIKH